jgi:hypothetical protein
MSFKKQQPYQPICSRFPFFPLPHPAEIAKATFLWVAGNLNLSIPKTSRIKNQLVL